MKPVTILLFGICLLVALIAPVLAGAGLSVVLVANPSPVEPGETITYNVIITNGDCFADHSETWIDIDPRVENINFDVGCYQSGNSFLCAQDIWGFGPHFQGDLFGPITGTVKSDTPSGTHLISSVSTVGFPDPMDNDPNCWGGWGGQATSNVLVQKNSVPAPEFPSEFLPMTLIIGFLGAVLLIRRTREN